MPSSTSIDVVHSHWRWPEPVQKTPLLKMDTERGQAAAAMAQLLPALQQTLVCPGKDAFCLCGWSYPRWHPLTYPGHHCVLMFPLQLMVQVEVKECLLVGPLFHHLQLASLQVQQVLVVQAALWCRVFLVCFYQVEWPVSLLPVS